MAGNVAWDDYVSTGTRGLKNEGDRGVGSGHVIKEEGPDKGKEGKGKG